LINGRRTRLFAQHLNSNLSGIFFGIIDVLSVVPVSGGDTLALDGNCAGPGGTTTYFESVAVKVKVGVLLQLHCNAETRTFGETNRETGRYLADRRQC